MDRPGLLPRSMGALLVLVLLTGCFAPTTTGAPPPAPPGQPSAQSGQPTVQASTCSRGEPSILGVLRSTDHGATWTSLGNACLPDASIGAVDPTGFVVDGQIVLYFVDIVHLNQPVPQVLYRATSTDGVHFETLQPAYTQPRTMVDPSVVRMADGAFRVYVPSDQEGIISAVSNDGLSFAPEDGVRFTEGGMPGALLLPDGRVRVFLCGEAITSFISNDGLNFTRESGVRIQPDANMMVDNPQPIRLNDGSYLMLFSVHPTDRSGQPDPWTFTETRFATSTDGLNWTVNPTIIGYGGTSCAVEMPDGTLYVYYVNGNPSVSAP
jgi:hypothetical protein